MLMVVRRICLAAFFSLLMLTGAFAQLGQAPPYSHRRHWAGKRKQSARTANTPLRLPFFDDFSTYSGLPKDSLWINGGVSVNNRLSLNRPPGE
jgi:hypothetical protein